MTGISADGALPGVTGEQAQNGENLQPAQKHIQNQDQLAQNTESAEIAGWAYGFQAGADVVEAAQHGGEVGAGGEAVQAQQQETDEQDEHIGNQVSVGAFHHLFVHRLVIVPDHLDPIWVQHLQETAAKALKQQNNPGNLNAAAGGAGTGADDLDPGLYAYFWSRGLVASDRKYELYPFARTDA